MATLLFITIPFVSLLILGFLVMKAPERHEM